MLAIGGGQDRKQGILTTAKRFSSTFEFYDACSALQRLQDTSEAWWGGVRIIEPC
jgi:hypothetical protein